MPSSKLAATSLLLLASGSSPTKSKRQTRTKKTPEKSTETKKKQVEMRLEDEHKETAAQAAQAGGDEEDDENTKKSERKRMREKQRRSDLTNAFDDLAAFVLKVDGNEEEGAAEQRETHRRKRSKGDVDEASGLTRVDLIAKALSIMKRLHQENGELKRALARSGHQRDKNEIMVMVPTLTPADEGSPPMAVGSYRPPAYGYQPHHSLDQGPPPYPPTQQSPRYHPPPLPPWGYRENQGPPPMPPAGHPSRYPPAENRGSMTAGRRWMMRGEPPIDEKGDP